MGEARLREFYFAAYRQRRGHLDDASLRPGETVEADIWTEFHGAVLVPIAETDGLPDWEQGGYMARVPTGDPVRGWDFAGRPPQFLIECYEEGRLVDGVVIGTALGKRRKE